VADEFLVEGQRIVTARGNHNDRSRTRRATAEGAFEHGALIGIHVWAATSLARKRFRIFA
jgi:hypothetical protein